MNRNLDLLIPRQIIQAHSLSNFAIASYCGLQILKALPCRQYISVKNIYTLLSGGIDTTRGNLKKLREGLNELQSHEIISFEEEYKEGVIIDFSKDLKFKPLYFCKVSLHEVQAIFSIESSNSFYLLRYFLVLIGSINNATKVGALSMESLATTAGISPRVVSTYNHALENHGLLYVNHAPRTEGARITKYGNVYGRPEHKKEIDAYAAKIRKSFSE